MKLFDTVSSVKRKIDLILAFAAGTAIGYSAGIGVKVLEKLLDCKDGTDSDDGISAKKAESLKKNLETAPSVPINEVEKEKSRSA